MLNNQPLEPYEKIRQLRIYIGCSQKDISKGITRNLISQIENNRGKLTENTAKIISHNMNKFIETNNIQYIKITPEFLLESKSEQLNKIAEKYINELQAMKAVDIKENNFTEKIKEIESFLQLNQIDCLKQVKIEDLISDIYFRYNNYIESSFKISLAIELALQNNYYILAIDLLLKSLRDYDNDELYNHQLRVLKIAHTIYKTSNISNEEILTRILFNMAWCYEKLEMYNESILSLESLLSSFQFKMEKKLDIYLLKALCLEKLNKYDDSEELYLSILKLALENSNIIVISKVYNSLGTIYRFKKDVEKSLFYAKSSIDIKKNIPTKNYARTMYLALENYIEMDLELEINNIYFYALDQIEKSRDENMFIRLSNKLYDYFSNKNLDNIDNLIKKLEMNVYRKFITNKEAILILFKESDRLRDINICKSNSLLNRGVKCINFLEKK